MSDLVDEPRDGGGTDISVVYSGDGVMTAWCAIAQAIDSDGRDILIVETSPGMSPWTKNGLLHFALFDAGRGGDDDED